MASLRGGSGDPLQLAPQKDVGLSRLRLMTNIPKKIDAFAETGVDLQVVEQVPIQQPVDEYRAGYLAAKRDKMWLSCLRRLRRISSARRCQVPVSRGGRG